MSERRFIYYNGIPCWAATPPPLSPPAVVLHSFRTLSILLSSHCRRIVLANEGIVDAAGGFCITIRTASLMATNMLAPCCIVATNPKRVLNNQVREREKGIHREARAIWICNTFCGLLFGASLLMNARTLIKANTTTTVKSDKFKSHRTHNALLPLFSSRSQVSGKWLVNSS